MTANVSREGHAPSWPGAWQSAKTDATERAARAPSCSYILFAVEWPSLYRSDR